ncbi:primosomal protein N' [Alginatibacterium sediminis]|uniref:Replication restart protein PriA n=1 Tax=Alginatibacterium sediminis TaxID=2164068 RepID=A0A420E5Y6_9ALTE|nr:primosomal protein N' [Alginatibacterium sediminis]RKF13120.1 primosomal protein N' [Alginatibacterium sediminis]
MKFVRVALPLKLRRTFDYLVPEELDIAYVGARVRVPFGSRQLIGIVLEYLSESEYDPEKLKPIIEYLDHESIFEPNLEQALCWASEYYHHPLGDVFNQALPVAFRQGASLLPQDKTVFRLSELGLVTNSEELKRAPLQQQLLKQLQTEARDISNAELKVMCASPAPRKALIDKGLLLKQTIAYSPKPWSSDKVLAQEPLQLNTQQAIAVSSFSQLLGRFGCALLEGVTGSGKTEVYLQLIELVLKAQQQVLVLVPEISLTPQTIARFEQRFNVPIVAMHSGLNDSQRLLAWQQARCGEAALVIGTRSAVFSCLPHLGLIVIDEEHDSSFKQQESFRYHARDLAIVRAKNANVPIIMGSATPALETLHNAMSGRYHHLHLAERAGGAVMARQRVIDVRHQPMQAGLAPQLLKQMREQLEAGHQVMLFLNRRGYAPALLCHECGAVCTCPRCDAFFTLHQKERHLACHHCGNQQAIERQCGGCGSTNLVTTGLGTEQIESFLSEYFPQYSIARIDRDSTRRKGSLERLLTEVSERQHQILIGTQMLAKGHHFPHVTLVALVDVDHALYSNDFRSSEKLAQLVTQVAGRAGRGAQKGEVLLQSHHPEHELLQDLVNNGYAHFAKFALNERQQTQLPPASFQALFRFSAMQLDQVEQLSNQLYQHIMSLSDLNCLVLPPNTAPQARLAGKHRMQLLLQAQTRPLLHRVLHHSVHYLEHHPMARKVRWSIDVDPIDLY